MFTIIDYILHIYRILTPFISLFLIIIIIVIFFKNLNIEVKIKNILEEQNIIRGFIKFLFYLKRILPLGIFTIAFDDFYKHDDTQELKYLKNSYVKNIRIMQLSIIFILLNLVLLLFSPFFTDIG